MPTSADDEIISEAVGDLDMLDIAARCLPYPRGVHIAFMFHD